MKKTIYIFILLMMTIENDFDNKLGKDLISKFNANISHIFQWPCLQYPTSEWRRAYSIMSKFATTKNSTPGLSNIRQASFFSAKFAKEPKNSSFYSIRRTEIGCLSNPDPVEFEFNELFEHFAKSEQIRSKYVSSSIKENTFHHPKILEGVMYSRSFSPLRRSLWFNWF